MPIIGIYQFDDLVVSGPDPWLAGANANSSSPGNTTFTLALGAEPILAEIVDDDLVFDDNDNSQDFASSTTINGTTYLAGDKAENEYSYGIRPVGSTDPGDIITVYSIDEGGATPSFGFASTAEIVPGVTYEIVHVDSNSPSVSYSSLFVCFAEDTRIRTPTGECPVQDLSPGDLIETFDNGPQPILWAGSRKLQFLGQDDRQKPVSFSAGCFGGGLPMRDLRVAPQHRFFINPPALAAQNPTGVLVPAKALLPRAGVRQMKGCREVTYHTLLLPRHEILFAEGAPVETFYPAPYGLSLLTRGQRLAVCCSLPGLTRDVLASYGPTARPLIGASKATVLASMKQLLGDRCRFEEPEPVY